MRNCTVKTVVSYKDICFTVSVDFEYMPEEAPTYDCPGTCSDMYIESVTIIGVDETRHHWLIGYEISAALECSLSEKEWDHFINNIEEIWLDGIDAGY